MPLRLGWCLLAAAGVLLGACDAGTLVDESAAATEPAAVASDPTTTTPTPTAPATAMPIPSSANPSALGTPAPTTTATAAAPISVSWTVVYIVDGDTVDVRSSDGVEERIRVIGIDTPEQGQCGFEEAADALARLVADQNVTLVAGARDDRDRYGRLLRYLDVGAVDVGLELIRAGHAIARYDSRDGYGRHPREDTYVAADVASLDVCEAPVPAATAVPPVAQTPAATTVQVFRNCAELNVVYPGGVAKVGVTGNIVSGTLRPFGITPHFDDELYAANVARDGDKDGIACEK